MKRPSHNNNSNHSICPFKKCNHGYLIDSPIKAERDHVKRYHLDVTETIGIMGAIFSFRRDPSKDYKYVCICRREIRNPFSLRNHVQGIPFQSKPPCGSICTKAEDIVANNIIFDDDTNPITYRPAISLPIQEMPHSEDNNLEIMSDIDVDENTLPEPNVDPNENMNTACHSQVGHVQPRDNLDTDLDFYRILMDNDLALDNAIKALQKTRTDIQKLLQNPPK